MSPRTNKLRLRNGFILLAVIITMMLAIAVLVDQVETQGYKAMGEIVR